MKIFKCEKYHTDMPAEAQPGFCRRRHENAKPGDHCLDYHHGIEAAEEKTMAMCQHTCKKCGEDFQGGPTAKTCPKCKTAKGTKEKAPSRKSAKSAKKVITETFILNEDEKVIDVLIATGALSQQVVDSTRRYVREMHA